jgi:tetratricopeptide (TPR) repeat protein
LLKLTNAFRPAAWLLAFAVGAMTGATIWSEHAVAAGVTKQRNTYRYADPVQRKKALDALFAKLKSTEDGAIAQAAIQQIWLIWNQSGRRPIDDLLSRAKININEGEYEAALKKFDEVVRRAPDFAEGWNGRATVLFLMGRYTQSLADIVETLKREPRHFGALAGRGMIFVRLGQYAAALKAFDEALRYNPFISERHELIPALRRKLGVREL